MIFGFPFFDYALFLLPSLFFMSLSIIAPIIGLALGATALRAKKANLAFRHSVAALISGSVGLFFLWDLLFNRGLSKGSTAGLAFLFIPFFSLGGLLLGYVLVLILSFIFGLAKIKLDGTILSAKVLFFITSIIITASFIGILKESISSIELSVSERASSASTLRYMLEKSKRPEANKFGITLFLAQNTHAPEDILVELSRSEFGKIRAQVANNPSTPLATVEALRRDCEEYVRKIVAERLKEERLPEAETCKSK